MPHEAISVFDMFKIGVGPSSSHTLGPWRAALECMNQFKLTNQLSSITNIEVLLYGSLAKTGIGHGTDIAILMGLLGEDPITVPIESIDTSFQTIKLSQKLHLFKSHSIPFETDSQIHYLVNEVLPFHSNGITFLITLSSNEQISETFYSIGGGFVVKEGGGLQQNTIVQLPFPINTSADLLHWCRKTGLNIYEIVWENELAWRNETAIKSGILAIWETMKNCIFKGCFTEGELPGGLHVNRRAYDLNKKLLPQKQPNNYNDWLQQIRSGGNGFTYILDWVSCFALAVNEENASFGRVVTAPTNGAAGVIPAVLQYYIAFCCAHLTAVETEQVIIRFLLTASEIGSIFKKGATISAAMGGCQAEIGVSSAMAAAALTECVGGTQKQVLMAAEIAMEHHLGLTCDPIGGLVQIPCIERNTMGAIKAITASQLAMQSTPDFAKVSLDKVIKTMWETALDMNSKYKETSDGGLAIHIPISLSEC